MLRDLKLNFNLKLKNNLAYYISFIILGLFPIVPFSIKPYLLAPICLTSIVHSIKHKKHFGNLRFPGISCLLFLPFFISFFHSSDTNTAVDLLLRLSPFLLIPLAFSVAPVHHYESYKNGFINTFIVSCFFFCILICGYSLSLDSNDLPYIYSHIRDKFWGYEEHPIYISLYLGLSLILLVQSTLKKNIKFIFFITIFFTLLFLSRKGNILSLFFVLLFTLMYRTELLINKTSLRLFLVASTIFTLSIFLFNNFIVERFKAILDVGSFLYNPSLSSGIRSIVWRSCIALISESPFIGYGLGDVQVLINSKLIDDGYEQLTNLFSYNAPVYYNAHNQYLQLSLSSGLFGLFVFLVILAWMILKLIKKKDVLGLNIFIYLMLCFMFESYLERQNGIIISAIFFNLFYFNCRTSLNQKQ